MSAGELPALPPNAPTSPLVVGSGITGSATNAAPENGIEQPLSTSEWLLLMEPETSPLDQPVDPSLGGKPVALEGFELPNHIDMNELKTIDGSETGKPLLWQRTIPNPRYTIYRDRASIADYMPGDGEQFGWIDFQSTPYLPRGQSSGLTTAMGLHLLSGPNSVPLPPRLWDFILGYQARDTFADRFSYDIAANVGVYSDFEDSVRDGVRALGHAVGMLHVNEIWDIVSGVDYLNRDDCKILPVIGYSWHNPSIPRWRVDMVFPRPRIQYVLDGGQRLYTAGLLGGGTWDIEMPGDVNDVITYRDLEWLFGHEHITTEGNISAIEMGYVFGRKLEFRSGQPDVDFNDAFVIRWITRR
ncbi:MAG: hypothetical protein FJ308_07755 [Planctomycetes bacterium]|nr:hypothetical protein [Planctomycetota bacterium]